MPRTLFAKFRRPAALAGAVLAASLGVTGPAQSDETVTLGIARLFNNDLIGDGRDRWRTGGYSVSLLRGPEWQGDLPNRPGALLEYRLRTEIIVPGERFGTQGFRPYVGALSLGVHTYFGLGPLDASAGLDVLAMGPQTGVSDFQEGFHDLFGLSTVRGVTSQLGDAIHVGGTVELAYPVRLSQNVSIRPFIEAQAGIEALARVGADIVIGPVGHDDLVTRDVVTGQLIRAVAGPGFGLAFVAGADWAQVGGSVFLPDARGIVAETARVRARAGVHWQFTPDISAFYGVSYLSEEYVGQPEGQIVGSLKLNFNF